MLAEVKTIARLQDLDTEVHVLQAELADLPKRLMAERKVLEDRRKEIDALKAELVAQNKERVRRENDIVLHQGKIAKLKKQILEAMNQTQYQAFEHEIQFSTEEIGRSEERVLELMESVEELEKRIVREEAEHKAAQKAAADHFKAAEQRNKQGLEQIQQLGVGRKELVASLPPQAASLYERLRRKYKTGPIVSEPVDGHCSVCQMIIRPAYLQEVLTIPKLFQCEECSRVFVYDPPIDNYDVQ